MAIIMKKRAPIKKVVNLAPSKQCITITSNNSNDVYHFDSDIELIDTLIEWCFSNTSHRFVLVGTSRFYFEDIGDAVAFKLAFGGKG